jgi:hypothetical protein
MSKWEDSFNKNTKNACYCSNDEGLFVPNRQLSIVVAGLLFLFFSCFMIGYFIGKRSVVEQFTQKMCQESFSDQIYTAVVASHDLNNQDADQSTGITVHNTDVINTSNIVTHNSHIVDNNNNEQITQQQQEHVTQEAINTTQFYAQLIGFGTEKAAQKFVQKLALKDIETCVKKRISKTAKGRTIYWYQVVTPPCDDKEVLTTLVNRLTKEEKLSGTYISSC